jgi:hypothetical protein
MRSFRTTLPFSLSLFLVGPASGRTDSEEAEVAFGGTLPPLRMIQVAVQWIPSRSP